MSLTSEAPAASGTASPAAWTFPPIAAPEAEAVIPFAAGAQEQDASPELIERENIRQTDFGAHRRPVERILVLKLDHFGDFVIGLPALRRLRAAFPQATIRLVCGRWNERNARASGLVDEVRAFDFFPASPHRGKRTETDPLAIFDQAVEGRFDLAIDLRVDEDTRHLLGRVDARLRCGIGSASRLPLLDIALPDEHAERANSGLQSAQFRFLAPGQFNSSLPAKTPFYHQGPLVRGDFVHGPYAELPTGALVATVGVTIAGYLPSPLPASVKVDVVRDGGQIVGTQVFGRRNLHKLRGAPVTFRFDNTSERSKYEFRIQVAGRPLAGTLRFSGVSVEREKATPPPRFRPVELHVGEKLSLLVALVVERTADLYNGLLPASETGSEPPRRAGLRRIAIAPFSNSSTRDWPAEHYARLIGLLLDRAEHEVVLVGTSEQASAARALVADIRSTRLVDLVGRTRWDELPSLLRSSDLVICNNSGVAHLAAAAGVSVLGIYSGSHQPQEWGPRGMRSRALMYEVSCSPCGFERVAECPAGHACMRLITPEYVLEEAIGMLEAAAVDDRAPVPAGPGQSRQRVQAKVPAGPDV